MSIKMSASSKRNKTDQGSPALPREEAQDYQAGVETLLALSVVDRLTGCRGAIREEVRQLRRGQVSRASTRLLIDLPSWLPPIEMAKRIVDQLRPTLGRLMNDPDNEAQSALKVAFNVDLNGIVASSVANGDEAAFSRWRDELPK